MSASLGNLGGMGRGRGEGTLGNLLPHHDGGGSPPAGGGRGEEQEEEGQEMDPGREMTGREAAQYADLGEKTVRRWIKSGRLKARRVAGNRFAIRKIDLEEAIGGLVYDPVGAVQRNQRDLERTVLGIQEEILLRLAELERRVASLERGGRTSGAAPDDDEPGSYGGGGSGSSSSSSSYLSTAYRPHGGSPEHVVKTRYPAPVQVAPPARGEDYFLNKTERGEYLERHGVKMSTSRNSSGPWRECPMGPRRAVLEWTVAHQRSAGYRARGRDLHRCDETLCECQDTEGMA